MIRKKNMFPPTKNPIMVEIANNDPLLPFRLVPWNFHKPTKAYYTSNTSFILKH
jgi:hypothetical protein